MEYILCHDMYLNPIFVKLDDASIITIDKIKGRVFVEVKDGRRFTGLPKNIDEPWLDIILSTKEILGYEHE